MTDEIALFIDFENIRYSLINVQHREPDPQELIGVARRFGTVMVARAYADWQRQPEFFKGSLTAAMIDRVDCPSKVRERFRQNPVFAPGFAQPAPFERPYDRFPPREQPSNGDAYADEEPRQLGEGEEDADHRLNGAADLADESPLAAEDLNASNPNNLVEERMDDRLDDRRGRFDSAPYAASYGNHGGNGGGGYYPQTQAVITQSTVDLNMLMDIIETVFDRPSISTFVLMTGDRDFTRIGARLKLRLNKRVIVVGVPGTVSRDLISAAEQFIPLGFGNMPQAAGNSFYRNPQPYATAQGPVEPDEPGFVQFLDYIDKHWSWRTVSGVANFIGDPFNPKNRFRGRLTRDSARDLLRICVDEGILTVGTDAMGSENLRLNRDHPAVSTVLSESAMR